MKNTIKKTYNIQNNMKKEKSKRNVKERKKR